MYLVVCVLTRITLQYLVHSLTYIQCPYAPRHPMPKKEIFILESDWLAARVHFHQPLHCKVGLLIIKVKSFPPLCPQILWAPHLIMDVQQEIINCQFIPSGFHFSLEILIHSSTSSLQLRYTI